MAAQQIDLPAYDVLCTWGLHDLASHLYMGRGADRYLDDSIASLREVYDTMKDNYAWGQEFGMECCCVMMFLCALRDARDEAFVKTLTVHKGVDR